MKRFTARYPFIKALIHHTGAWSGIFMLLFFLRPTVNINNPAYRFHQLFHTFNILLFLILIVVFYLTAFLLTPKLLYKKKLAAFALIQLLILLSILQGVEHYLHLIVKDVVLSNDLPPYFEGFPAPGEEGEQFFRLPYGIIIFPYLITLAASITFSSIKDNNRRESKRKEQQMANLTSELQFLKSQVSPHFLFNVLNNLTFLARKRSTALEPALIKLSTLLRYMLYDADEDEVLLEKEIKYLEDYIDLQSIRYQDMRVNAFFRSDNDELTIAPMLLIPFVENAFKHAGSFVDNQSFIKIELLTDRNKLYFSVWNKYTFTKPEQSDKSSGIGLSNVKKRLQLLYPQQHSLQVEKEKDVFMVSLQINLANIYETTLHRN
ncbi:MAG: histidine kinase [Chitinophagaceae bacterium]|nr:histidine kinase [Chitinophagaceae bacterium]